ncbi:hypothetical protein R3P38DRAFT_2959870, partial [Favolaschia claudopus]
MLVAQCLCTAPTLASALLLPWCMMGRIRLCTAVCCARGEPSSPSFLSHFTPFLPHLFPPQLASTHRTLRPSLLVLLCGTVRSRRSEGWWHRRRLSLPCLLSC